MLKDDMKSLIEINITYIPENYLYLETISYDICIKIKNTIITALQLLPFFQKRF